jgi:surface antigen
MVEHPMRRVAVGLALGLFACADHEGRASEQVGVAISALSVCEEDVPDNRYIDGIPAYAQCAAAEDSAIYSRDGIETSTTSLGADWIRTQWSGGYQCTELAHRYLYFVWGIDWVPRGNAGTWCDTSPSDEVGIVQTETPVHGDLMVLPPGSCGAAASTGHVAIVDTVLADGRLSVVEQNRANRGTYQRSCAGCFLHVVANDGTGNPGVGGSGSGEGGAGGEGGAAGAAGGGTAGSGAAGVQSLPEPMQPAPMPTTPTPATPVPPSMPGAAGSAAPPPTTLPEPAPAPLAAPLPPPLPVVPREASEPEAASCSVTRGRSAPSAPIALALACVALAARRATRRRARGPLPE